MNYFAHARRFLDGNPYFVAGVALPDWLGVVDRKVRVQSKRANPWINDADPDVVSFARGILRHHRDDDWFHTTVAFVELSLGFAKDLRELLADDDGARPSFLGHILVEMLLDSELISAEPAELDRYYDVIRSLDRFKVQRMVNEMAARPTDNLAFFIERFCELEFLYDYSDDEKLLGRLNGVMKRVNLPALPDRLREFFPEARRTVARRRDELLAGETE
ncbi:MAG: hypothetical protein QGG36_01110 [Pirellulaceae bacterium]|jgi:hypothetical protein|nr:hypothetical protein [Pirellulaceae bacterium]MDP7014376.1 hypothetical protein [Pirellulaceae bacterium]